MPRKNIPRANTHQTGGKYCASRPPVTAPMRVPRKRSWEICKEAPRVDCRTTIVEMAAQYASGRRKTRAMRNEAVAAIAVRAALITAGQPKRDGKVVGGHSSGLPGFCGIFIDE